MSDHEDDDFFGDFDSAPATVAAESLPSDSLHSQPTSTANELSSTLNDASAQSDDNIMKLSDKDFLQRAKNAWATEAQEATTIDTQQNQQTLERLRLIMLPVLERLKPPAGF
jgi:prophage DNA circulation protein